MGGRCVLHGYAWRAQPPGGGGLHPVCTSLVLYCPITDKNLKPKFLKKLLLFYGIFLKLLNNLKKIFNINLLKYSNCIVFFKSLRIQLYIYQKFYYFCVKFNICMCYYQITICVKFSICVCYLQVTICFKFNICVCYYLFKNQVICRYSVLFIICRGNY